MAWSCISSTILLVFITQVHSQFFDFFGFQPTQRPKLIHNEYTTRRTKPDIIRVHQEPQMTWKNTTIYFSYDGIERDDDIQSNTSKEKKRKQSTPAPIPTLLPIFNYYTTTVKPARKTTKGSVNRKNVTANVHSRDDDDGRKNNNNKQMIAIVDNVQRNGQQADWYDRPINNVADNYNRPIYETTARPTYNNKVNYNTNEYTTKSQFYNRPGVKPIVVDNRPPITNRPVTQRPYRPETERPYRPETQRPYRPETQRPNRPETERPYRPETQRPATSKPTVKPYIVNPIPTDAGALVFPHEDEPPEIIRGPDEDYMSDAEKRRYIEMAEKMCDKYKALNMKQLAAIPLLPSPEPVAVNVSQCTPAQIPLVVGGKVVSISEFPHMALLGWVKIDGGGYSWKCGGSLISDQYILTAAHCSYEERDNTVITGAPRVVQLGSSYLDDPGALVVRVAAVIRHPKYKFPKSYHDLAVLKLVQPVTFSEVIKPACLGVPPGVDRPIIATGWGKTEFGGDQSLELRSVSLPIWNMDRCKEILGTSRKMPQGPLRDSQICAGEKRGGKDTCQGDSGGPAQLQDGCVWRVVAVTSLGRSCGAPNTPGLYALVQRAFVAAAVFGNYKSNQRRSDNSQANNNDNRRQIVHTTTQGYRSNNNGKSTTESYYNPPENGYVRQNSNRRTTTDPYYNPPQNDYSRTNTNRRTTTESYYNPPQNDYGRPNTNYNNRQKVNRNTPKHNDNRALDTDAGFYDQQRDSNGNPNHNNRPQNDYWAGNQPRTDYNRKKDDRYDAGSVWFT